MDIRSKSNSNTIAPPYRNPTPTRPHPDTNRHAQKSDLKLVSAMVDTKNNSLQILRQNAIQ